MIDCNVNVSVTVMISQSPSGSSISVLALEISSVSSSVQCSDTEKASLTTEIRQVLHLLQLFLLILPLVRLNPLSRQFLRPWKLCRLRY